MSDSSDWMGHPVDAATNYAKGLASDIWNGHAEKHPYAITGGIAALSLLGIGAGFAITRRIESRLMQGVLNAGLFIDAVEVAPFIPRSLAVTGDIAELGSQAAALNEGMPTSLYERFMAAPGKEIATRPVQPGSNWDVKILNTEPGTRQALSARRNELNAMNIRSEMTIDDYIRDLNLKSSKFGKVDDQTYIARTYNGYGRMNDVVVRVDQNTAVEQVLKANRSAQMELKETRFYDFTSGQVRSYYNAGQQGVLRTNVGRGVAKGTWLGEDSANSELSKFRNNLFFRSAKGKDITGYHQILSDV